MRRAAWAAMQQCDLANDHDFGCDYRAARHRATVTMDRLTCLGALRGAARGSNSGVSIRPRCSRRGFPSLGGAGEARVSRRRLARSDVGGFPCARRSAICVVRSARPGLTRGSEMDRCDREDPSRSAEIGLPILAEATTQIVDGAPGFGVWH